MRTEAELKFIREHLDADLPRLVLSARKYPGLPVAQLAGQIAALRKLRDKAPSWFDPALLMPPLVSVEQASSEPAARFKSGLVAGKKVADLTGGLGIDAGFFAEQFDNVVYVEQDADLAAIARHNFAVKGIANIRVVHGNAEAFLETPGGSFDLLYLDPLRRDERMRKVFRLADCTPDVTALREKLLDRAPAVLLKTAPLLDLQSAVRDLCNVAKIWVVAVRDEVKEVLFLLERNPAPDGGDIPVTAVNLETGQADFVFSRNEEAAAEPEYAASGVFLYEPNAAILKAGAFRLFGARFGLKKLHPHTHLYTSDHWVEKAPGRSFRVVADCKYDKKTVLAHLAAPKANITARNFPDPVEQIRKKLGLSEGGDAYLFALTDHMGNRRILVCRKYPDAETS